MPTSKSESDCGVLPRIRSAPPPVPPAKAPALWKNTAPCSRPMTPAVSLPQSSRPAPLQPLDSAASASFPHSCAHASKMMDSSSLVTPSSGRKFPLPSPSISRSPAIADCSIRPVPAPNVLNALSDGSSCRASGLIIRCKISASSARVTCFSGRMLPVRKALQIRPVKCLLRKSTARAGPPTAKPPGSSFRKNFHAPFLFFPRAVLALRFSF